MRIFGAACAVVCAMAMASSVFGTEAVVEPRAAGTFSMVTPLNVARSQHSATLLGSGKVLVAGGEADGGSALTSSEIYDPVANKWTAAASLNIARKRHTATLLSNGTVLVAGGLADSGTIASAEIYDPVANTWSATSSMSGARQNHTATVLPNGKVLVAGGAKQTVGGNTATVTALNSSEIFDPSSNGWTAAPNMSKAHFFHTATLLQNNKVLIASGALTQTTATTTTTTAAELYDYTVNTWASGGTLVAGRAQAIAVPINLGRVLVAGGLNGTARLSSAELYDPLANTWTATGSLSIARSLHTGAVLSSGQVLAAAGFDGANVLNSAELYDPVAATWNAAGTLLAARQFHTATLLSGGAVLVAGGINQIELSSAESFSTAPVILPLKLDSPPTASPNPAGVGQAVTFSASASGGSGTLTYTWTFGDGTSGTGASVTHAYGVMGTFSASLTVTDSANSNVSGSTSVVVAGSATGVVVGVGADNDGDGFSNAVELTMGSNPNDPTSVPLGVTNVAAPLPIPIVQMQTRVSFRRSNRDLITFSGRLPIPDGFVPSGTKIGIDVNGVSYLAHLNSQARSGSVFQLKYAGKAGAVAAQNAFFSVKLSGGTYSPALAYAGLTNGDFIGKKVNITVSILYNATLYQAVVPQQYNARLNRYGQSRQ